MRDLGHEIEPENPILANVLGCINAKKMDRGG